jgi:heme exporter protein B
MIRLSLFFFLLAKEALLFRKSSTSFYGVFLYLISILFLCFFVFQKNIGLTVSNALFWFILLFISTQATSTSFSDYKKLRYYEYTLFSSNLLILVKYIQQGILLFFLFLFTAFCYWNLWNSEINPNYLFFVPLLFLAAFGFSSIFTLLSAISSRSNSALGLVAILGFPLILPFLLVLIRLSLQILEGFTWDIMAENFIFLSAIQAIGLMLSLLLFPYIWKD